MDMDFSPEDIAFREEVRAFLKDNLPARLRDGARRTPGVFVEPDIGMEWHRILFRQGWVAPHWPKEDGGTGWTPTQKFIFEKECALAGAPSLAILGLRLVGPVICEFGTPEQKARFLPGILSGDDYWCQGYSEPGSGSDLASLKTAARLDGDEYVINGSKIWTTHAHHADWIFALVRTDATVKKQAGISFLLVPMDQPGVSVTPIHSMSGDHEVNAVFFTDVLGHFAFEHVEDFLVDGVEVVIVGFSWGKSGADEEQVFGFDHTCFDEPFDVAPVEVDVFGIGGGDITIHEESENEGWWELGEGWVSASLCKCAS